MQQYYTGRNHVKEILWALPQKFYRFGKRLLYMFVDASKGNNFVETCLYALEIFKNIDIKYLFNFKEYFYLFDTFYKCCLKAYNSTPPTTTLSQRCHNVAVPAGQLCQESTVSFL